MLYSTEELFFIVASHSPVDMCTVDTRATAEAYITKNIHYISPAVKYTRLQQNIKICPPIWEICNTPLWWFPTWGTVMKCLSKSNTEISALAEICKGRHCHLISRILNKQQLCLNAVYKLTSAVFKKTIQRGWKMADNYFLVFFLNCWHSTLWNVENGINFDIRHLLLLKLPTIKLEKHYFAWPLILDLWSACWLFALLAFCYTWTMPALFCNTAFYSIVMYAPNH